MRNLMKQNKAITLIALVITIIVLLILAGVTITTLTGDNGLITKASDAKTQSEIAEEKDIISISAIQAQAENRQGNLEKNNFNEALSTNSKTGNKASIIAEDIGSFTVKFESNRYYEVDKSGNISHIENATGEKILTLQCVNSKNEILGEYEYTIVADKYSKLPPDIDKYESSEERIEGEITENKTIQVVYYLICNDDTTLVFTGLDGNGNITTSRENIENYMVGDGTANYGNGLRSTVAGQKYILEIPNEYNGHPITKIGGSFTFARTMIQKVILKSNLKTISRYSFGWCNELKNVVIESKNFGFGECAFQSCTQLNDFTIFAENIGNVSRVFANCSSLEKIKVNENNSAFTLGEDNVLYSKDMTKIIFYPPAKKGDYNFTPSVNEIGAGAFGNTLDLQQIEIPETITKVGNNAFTTSSIKKVSIRCSYIGYDMFRQCSNLEDVTIGKNVSSFSRLIFHSDNNLKEIVYEGKKEEWDAISKNSDWNQGTTNLKIKCSDGDIQY